MELRNNFYFWASLLYLAFWVIISAYTSYSADWDIVKYKWTDPIYMGAAFGVQSILAFWAGRDSIK